MNVMPVSVGLYRHFKGAYYYVTGISRHANNYDEFLVNYFDVCHPEKGNYTRPLFDFIATHEEDGRVIEKREDNVTGQEARFVPVTDLKWQISSVSTKQLIEELRRRTDSPIHELDIEGLESKVFSNDYVVGIPHNHPDFSKGVEVILASDTLERAVKYLENHQCRKNTKIYKRTFIEM